MKAQFHSTADPKSKSPNKTPLSAGEAGAKSTRVSLPKQGSNARELPSEVEPDQTSEVFVAERRVSKRLTRGSSVSVLPPSESADLNVLATTLTLQQQQQTKEQQGLNANFHDRITAFNNPTPPIFVFGVSENPNPPEHHLIVPIHRGRGRPRKQAPESESNFSPARQVVVSSQKVQNTVLAFSSDITIPLATTTFGNSADGSSSSNKNKSSESSVSAVSQNQQQPLTPARKAALASRKVKNNIFKNYQGISSSSSWENGTSNVLYGHIQNGNSPSFNRQPYRTPSIRAAVTAKRVTASKNSGEVSHIVERKLVAALSAETTRTINVRGKAAVFEKAAAPMKEWSSDEEKQIDKVTEESQSVKGRGKEKENNWKVKEEESLNKHSATSSSNTIKAIAGRESDVPKLVNSNFVPSKKLTKNLVVQDHQQPQQNGFSSPLRQPHAFEDFYSACSSPIVSPAKNNNIALVKEKNQDIKLAASSSDLTDNSDTMSPFISQSKIAGSPARKLNRVEHPRSARKPKESATTSANFDETVIFAPPPRKSALKTPKKLHPAPTATYKSIDAQTMAATYDEKQPTAAYGFPVLRSNPTAATPPPAAAVTGKRSRSFGGKYDDTPATVKRGGQGSKKRFKVIVSSEEEDEMDVNRSNTYVKASAKHLKIGNDEDEEDEDDADNNVGLKMEKDNRSTSSWVFGFVKGLVKPFLG
ncbi:hypothetical protein HK100_004103 [Physocladia obscura]|uniref:Uncharacterized protein n=1 Tax=Physocladia obscura TaxID=109957 RepID=A0AAD5SU87_9FUNG|nr:hypothetical protein HK100_004103 [Physocladia obscura]